MSSCSSSRCCSVPGNSLFCGPTWQPDFVGSCKQQRVLPSSIWGSVCWVPPSKETLNLTKHLPPNPHLAEFAYNGTLYLSRASTLVNFSCKSRNHCYSKSLSAAGGCYKLPQSPQYHPALQDSKKRGGAWHPDGHLPPPRPLQPRHLSFASTWRLPQVLTAHNSKKLSP